MTVFLIAMQLIVAVIGMLVAGFAYDPNMVSMLAAGIGVAALGAFMLMHSDMAMAALLLSTYTKLVISALLLSVISYVFASRNAPYIDSMLIELDYRMFGFSWFDIANAMEKYPIASMTLSIVYETLAWQPFVLIGLLILQGSQEVVEVFTLAWLLATTACVVALPFLPALGGYLHYGTTPDDYPYVLSKFAWNYEPLITGARNGDIHVLGADPVVGLVTFPSFHAAGAVILAIIGSRTRAAPVFISVNAAMLVSTVPIGGHYIVDVAAGVGIAILALVIAQRFSRPIVTRRAGRHSYQLQRSMSGT